MLLFNVLHWQVTLLIEPIDWLDVAVAVHDIVQQLFVGAWAGHIDLDATTPALSGVTVWCRWCLALRIIVSRLIRLVIQVF